MYIIYVHIYVRIYRTGGTEKRNAHEIRIIEGSQLRRPMERLDVECAESKFYWNGIRMYTARTAPFS